jgi:hypothetical protein
MKKVQLVVVIALAALAAGCASHQYTRDDMTDKRAFKHQLKADSITCKKSGTDYDACMTARGWRHRSSGEARFHAAPAAGVASASQSSR